MGKQRIPQGPKFGPKHPACKAIRTSRDHLIQMGMSIKSKPVQVLTMQMKKVCSGGKY